MAEIRIPRGIRTAKIRDCPTGAGLPAPVGFRLVAGYGAAKDKVTAAPSGASPESAKKQHYGSVDLDPILAKKEFADIVDEIVQNFTTRTGVAVKVSVEIQAESSGAGFDTNLQRTVKENGEVLRFKNPEFE